MKTLIVFGLLSFVWVSLLALSWIVRILVNGQLPVPVTVSLFGMGLIVLAVVARKTGWVPNGSPDLPKAEEPKTA